MTFWEVCGIIYDIHCHSHDLLIHSLFYFIHICIQCLGHLHNPPAPQSILHSVPKWFFENKSDQVTLRLWQDLTTWHDMACACPPLSLLAYSSSYASFVQSFNWPCSLTQPLSMFFVFLQLHLIELLHFIVTEGNCYLLRKAITRNLMISLFFYSLLLLTHLFHL
jgi:hypothetical protein